MINTSIIIDIFLRVESNKMKTTTIRQTRRSLPPVQEMRSLSDVLDFSFPPILESIQKELNLNEREGNLLLRDLLMFLFICGTNTTQKRYSPPKNIDEAWHIFLLFTKEYAKFCEKYFGHFLHHNPFTKATRMAESRKVVPILPVAQELFGKLSENWKSPPAGSICTCDGNCGCP